MQAANLTTPMLTESAISCSCSRPWHS